ncbi:MAG: hypothetical protein IKU10_01995 [Clostridia bacterium]|nr:hypothetical protein [Clostridia bacterium]
MKKQSIFKLFAAVLCAAVLGTGVGCASNSATNRTTAVEENVSVVKDQLKQPDYNHVAESVSSEPDFEENEIDFSQTQSEQAKPKQTTKKPVQSKPTPAKKDKQLTKIVRHAGEGMQEQYLFSYDSQGRLSTMVRENNTDNNKQTTTFTYDKNDNLIWAVTGSPVNQIKPGENSGYKYEYNSKGQLIAEASWEGGIYEIKHEYDANGRRVRSVGREAGYTQTFEYVYNQSGQMIKSTCNGQTEEGSSYQTIANYDYSYNLFTIIDFVENIEYRHVELSVLPNFDAMEQETLYLHYPQFLADADGYLAKIMDPVDSSVYEFYYNGQKANPV